MSSPIKQRLVGACILLALAIIFIPVLFDRETIEPLDTQTQIPLAPVIEDINIPEPEAYTQAKQRAALQTRDEDSETPANSGSRFLFSPRVDQPEASIKEEAKAKEIVAAPTEEAKPAAEDKLPEKAKSVAQQVEKKAANAERKVQPAEKTITIAKTRSTSAVENGAWLLQLASFADQESAAAFRTKVKRAGHKAYVETADTPNGKRSRVYIGPFTSRALIEAEKSKVDKRFALESLIVTYRP